MLGLRGNTVLVFRSRDMRCGAVGRVDALCVDELQADGVLMEAEGADACYVWSGQPIKEAQASNETKRVVDDAGQPLVRPGSARLEAVLAFEKNDKNRMRLVKAALRFCHAVDQAQRGGQFTMNWEFVPRGAGRKRSGGQSDVMTRARSRQDLERLTTTLGTESTHLLQQVLVFEKPMKRLGMQLGLGRRALDRRFQLAMYDLADAFDNTVRAEFRD